ncbi:hypothetical protein EAX61_08305 [Dokdonia sinensis]|uniref:DUF3221 domain-containing protein n=1 Tax=Dokdonia sinensis TaxID=2479847 RepID=A0A3M0G410_9FLAO|nr:hypothetical protein [Dokdonia sinensis]RMB59575.1 hypothetical protein EAX61_08305 [Dokdonia sinensis]
MKSLFMLLFTVSALITGIENNMVTQEDQTVEASFLGIVDGEYHFATATDKIAFQKIDEDVAAAINLEDKALQGKKFTVSYSTVEEEHGDGEIIEVKTITNLKPLEL